MSEQNPEQEPNAAESTEGVEEPLSEDELSEGQSAVDVNSGAAPQPGGYAGFHGLAEGHGAPPPGWQVSENEDGIEPSPPLDMSGDGELDEFTESERVKAAELETEAVSPDQEGVESEGLAEAEGELDEFTEQETADAMALETQGVDLSDDEDDEEEAPAEEAPADEAPADDEGDEGLYDELLSGSVADVDDYMDEHPDERDAIVEAERAGKNRKGITGDE